MFVVSDGQKQTGLAFLRYWYPRALLAFAVLLVVASVVAAGFSLYHRHYGLTVAFMGLAIFSAALPEILSRLRNLVLKWTGKGAEARTDLDGGEGLLRDRTTASQAQPARDHSQTAAAQDRQSTPNKEP